MIGNQSYKLDASQPTNPTPSSSSHTVGVANNNNNNNNNTIDANRGGATDTPSGVDGYSAEWSAATTQSNTSWTASSDLVSGLTGYDIFNALVSASTPAAPMTALSHTFIGAIPGPNRGYYIKAFDAAANRSGASNTLNFSGELGGETTIGADVTVNPETNISLTFNGISAPGTTTVTQATGNIPGPPSGFRFRGNVLNISTDASFTPPVRVAIRYNEDDVSGNEESLKLFHYDDNDNRWEDITLYVDTVNNIIVGETDSFSDFVLAEPETPATREPTPICF